MNDQGRVLEAALDLEAVSGRQGAAKPLVLAEILLAPPQVLPDRDTEALDQLVVAHEPRDVLRLVFRRFGRKVAESSVELDAHRPCEVVVALDRVVEQRVEILSAAFEPQDEGLVVDAGAEE